MVARLTGIPPLVDTLAREARFAFRALSCDKLTASIFVAILGLALAMNLVVLSIVDAVLLEPFDFGRPDDLVVVWEQDEARDAHAQESSFPNFLDWREESSSFADMAAMGSTFWGDLRFVGSGSPFTARNRAVSFSFFDTLGVAAARGRTFVRADDEPGAPPVMVVTHPFWQSKLGADPRAVGRSFAVLDSEPVTLVGVMPPGVEYPLGTEVWTTIGPALAAVAEGLRFTPAQERNLDVLFAIGRLRRGVTLETAQAELGGIVRSLHQEHRPGAGPARGVALTPLVDHHIGLAKPALWSLTAAVSLVFLLVCANAAGLLLVREHARRRDNAVRLALGAGSGRLARALLLETTMLVAASTTLGWLVAAGTLRAVVAAAPMEVPRLADVSLGAGTLAYGVALFVAAVLIILSLMLGTSSGCAHEGVLAGRRARAGRRGFGRRHALVSFQVALAFVLLIGAAAMGKSFSNLMRAELGFVPENLLTFEIVLSNDTYPTRTAKQNIHRAILAELESIPGVVGAAGVQPGPFRGDNVGNDWGFYIEGQAPDAKERNPRASERAVSTGYFRVMGTRLVRGRTFTSDDDESAPPVIVVSESLAETMWPGSDPLGEKICCRRGAWLTVVGVVENTRTRDIHAPRLDLYTHYYQGFANLPAFFVRTAADPVLVAESVRQRVRSIDARLFANRMTPMVEVMSRVYAPWRFPLTGFAVFGAVAAVLAGLGLFGLLAFGVREQQKELGIRMALGATRERIVSLVAGRAAIVVGAGCVAGSVGSVFLNRALRALVYGPATLTPTIYGVVFAVVFLAAGLAAFFPAKRATELDPSVSLREP